MLDLWTEKHRPSSLDEYVWRDPSMRQMVEGWIRDQATPHVLFSGLPGTGKTSLCLLLLRLLNIPSEDVLKINASRDRKIEEVQDKIIHFIDAWAFNPTQIKYILLDEADKLSPYAQGLLRGELEAYAHCTRFMFTCNQPHKIIPALHSRLQEIKFSALDGDEFLLRAADVLVREEVTFQPEVLMLYKDRTYPDLRKCIGLLQQNSRDGHLLPPRDDDGPINDYLLKVIDLFKRGRYLEGRKLIVAQADPDDYEELYRFFYQHLDLFGSTQDQQDEALLAIRRALVYHGTVGDREINLSACIVELSRIAIPV